MDFRFSINDFEKVFRPSLVLSSTMVPKNFSEDDSNEENDSVFINQQKTEQKNESTIINHKRKVKKIISSISKEDQTDESEEDDKTSESDEESASIVKKSSKILRKIIKKISSEEETEESENDDNTDSDEEDDFIVKKSSNILKKNIKQISSEEETDESERNEDKNSESDEDDFIVKKSSKILKKNIKKISSEEETDESDRNKDKNSESDEDVITAKKSSKILKKNIKKISSEEETDESDRNKDKNSESDEDVITAKKSSKILKKNIKKISSEEETDESEKNEDKNSESDEDVVIAKRLSKILKKNIKKISSDEETDESERNEDKNSKSDEDFITAKKSSKILKKNIKKSSNKDNFNSSKTQNIEDVKQSLKTNKYFVETEISEVESDNDLFESNKKENNENEIIDESFCEENDKTVLKTINYSIENQLEIIENSVSLIEISDDETISKKTSIICKKKTEEQNKFGERKKIECHNDKNLPGQSKNEPVKKTVEIQNFPSTSSTYQNLKPADEVNLQTSNEISKIQNEMRNLNDEKNRLLKLLENNRTIEQLHDKGQGVKERLKKVQELMKQKFENLEILKKKEALTWKELKILGNAVQPKTFGQKAIETHQHEKFVTMEALKKIHNSLKSKPDENIFEEDPKGLKVSLMPHQKRALAWLMWREKNKPTAGILADDMGLGKTLTMISLALKHIENNNNYKEQSDSEQSDEEEQSNKKAIPIAGTLVVCPASLLQQWESEINNKVKRNLLSVSLYHGNNKETSARRLAKHDFVITSYKLVGNVSSTLHKVKWTRIILDEGHIIRNHKTIQSRGACELKGKFRWVLTGTPIHNTEMDFYGLLKFLRISPFDDLTIWRKWVMNKNAGGLERLHTLIQSILLRRTKDEVQINPGTENLFKLPEKTLKLIDFKLNAGEMKIYHKFLSFSRTLFAQFLHQRAEKNSEFRTNSDAYYKMHKKFVRMQGNKEVKAHQILVLLLRLRQICCHCSLLKKMFEQDAIKNECMSDESDEDVDLISKLEKMNLDDTINHSLIENEEMENLASAASGVINQNNLAFDENNKSSKIEKLLETVNGIFKENKNDKIIIVSQWAGYLNLIGNFLEKYGLETLKLTGEVEVKKRMAIVDNFNRANVGPNILLLSLTAGGIGLNLVGANHLILADLHWNPQLEQQAQDRIYRFGQKKPVVIYKLVVLDTIEERIKVLQDSKLEKADNILTGHKTLGNKLTLNDLKLIFDM